MKTIKTFGEFIGESKSNDNWIQETHMKKGALKKQLGYDEDEKIPMGILSEIMSKEEGSTITVKGKEIKITKLMKKRASLAKTLKKMR